MPLDPQADFILGLVKASGLPELWQLTPDQAREQFKLRVAKLAQKESIYRTHDRRVPGPGADLTVRIYEPREAKPGERFPVLGRASARAARRGRRRKFRSLRTTRAPAAPASVSTAVAAGAAHSRLR